MSRYAIILMVLAGFTVTAIGCSGGDESKGKSEDKDKTPSNPAEAVMTYIGETIQKKDEARNQLGMTQVRQRIRNFWSANGRYPRDLGEFQSSTGPLPNPGAGFQYKYDPATGNITVVRQGM
ncbi:MAG: hypothetical protein E3J72_20725 [Planctomycetota bacterium]|nr:MAG: hypothetical protein E3J72_20725 [Planctomycetota bacterium]